MQDRVVIRSFESLATAAGAVNELVRAGIEHGAIEVRGVEPGAGPRRSVAGRVHLVIVDARSAQEQSAAAQILDRAGGQAVAAAHPALHG